jgi:hypothetical protein
VRASPHFWTTDGEIDALLAELPVAGGQMAD